MCYLRLGLSRETLDYVKSSNTLRLMDLYSKIYLIAIFYLSHFSIKSSLSIVRFPSTQLTSWRWWWKRRFSRLCWHVSRTQMNTLKRMSPHWSEKLPNTQEVQCNNNYDTINFFLSVPWMRMQKLSHCYCGMIDTAQRLKLEVLCKVLDFTIVHQQWCLFIYKWNTPKQNAHSLFNLSLNY